ncbi:MAG: SMP-30/gluconolactonase/LRE family protein [Myxococcota bacterium]
MKSTQSATSATTPPDRGGRRAGAVRSVERLVPRLQAAARVRLCAVARVGLVCAIAGLVAGLLAGARPGAAAPSFLAFESGAVRPMAMSADGSRLYAVNTPDGRLEVFAVDASGLTPIRSIPVGQEPVAVAVRSATEVWVVNHLSDSVSVVDPTAGLVVRTLLVGDEPRDIVFAGPGNGRAFVTTAHRGQHRTDPSLAAVPGAGDPQLTTEGIGRADVWVFDATNPGTAFGGTPLRIVTVFGDTPRGLARSVDGTKVWVAIHHSGNRTTAINNAFVCDGFSQTTGCTLPLGGLTAPGGVPGPARNVQGLQAPEVGLIAQQGSDGLWRDVLGRVWNTGTLLGSFVRFNLPDLDVFELDASTLTQTRAHAGVGTTLFNLAVNPVSGKVYVSNTDSKNLTKFEGPGITGGSTVQGHLAEARITVLDGTSVLPRHLNKHIDYATLASEPGFDPTQKDHSLATPLEMAVSADGSTLYVAAFGSSKVGVLPTAALESNTFDPKLLSGGYVDVTGGGPAGLVLDEARGRLFVYTRFDNGISMVDLASRSEVEHWTFPNQEPRAVVEGRPFLYDARISSGNGEASCASCHVFGDMDHLGWDLGNPDDLLTSNPMVIRFLPANVPPGLNGVGVVDVFHPMKGPMTTQTLRGMQNGGAMHWRGDRSNGFYGASPDDENLAFRNFIVAFQGLLGSEAPISDADMQRFADFALSLVLPPNPVRGLDGQLTASATQGRSFYLNTPTDGTLTCENCHRLDATQGFFGGGTFSTFEGSTQIVKVPHLRNAYAKVGMFGFLAPFGGGTGNTGDQVRGFGYSHDGSTDTLFRFVASPVFTFPSDVERRNVEAFMLQFDADLAPIVGQQVTLTAGNAAVAGPRIDLLIARAAAPFQSLLLGGSTTECELVVKGAIAGQSRGWVRLASGLFQRDDDPGQSALVSDAALRAQVASVGPLTYTCVAPGSGVRVGINRDLDTRLDALDNCPGNVNDDQADFDQDGLGDPCDPTPLPEPGLGAGLAAAVVLLAGLRRDRGRRLRGRSSRGVGAGLGVR